MSSPQERRRALLAEGGDAFAGVAGRVEPGDDFPFEGDRVAERKDDAVMDQSLGGRVGERWSRRQVPCQSLGGRERGLLAAQRVHQPEPVGVDRARAAPR